MGNARRFAKDHANDLRFQHTGKLWYVWNGKLWVPDDLCDVQARAKQTIANLIAWVQRTLAQLANRKDCEEVAELTNQLRSFEKWLVKSEMEPRLNAMVNLARSEPPIPIRAGAFDPDGMLLNVANGIVDLRTGELRPHDRSAMCSCITPIAYRPDAKAPRWEQFLNEVMCDDAGMITYVRRAVGYSLTASQIEQCLWFLYGNGSNGKSLFLELLKFVFGDYATVGAPGLLESSKWDKHPTQEADLYRRRLVILEETEEDRRMAEARVKRLTGSAEIKARFMKRDFFEFPCSHHLWIDGNYKPRIEGTDDGIWRRIRVVNFKKKFEGKAKDMNLRFALQAEAEGILAWAVRGCLEWQKSGLAEPESVTESVSGYRLEENLLQSFIAEYCTVDDGHEERAAILYKGYSMWLESCGEPRISQRAFGRRMTAMGFERKINNGTWYMGIKLA